MTKMANSLAGYIALLRHRPPLQGLVGDHSIKILIKYKHIFTRNLHYKINYEPGYPPARSPHPHPRTPLRPPGCCLRSRGWARRSSPHPRSWPPQSCPGPDAAHTPPRAPRAWRSRWGRSEGRPAASPGQLLFKAKITFIVKQTIFSPIFTI